MQIYYDRDSDPRSLQGKKIAIIGYGSQGYAHSNNLKDSGHNVVVGLRPGSQSWAKAEKAGLQVKSTPDAAAWAEVIMMLVPDETAPWVYRDEIASPLSLRKDLAFAPGFSVHLGKTVQLADVYI